VAIGATDAERPTWRRDGVVPQGRCARLAGSMCPGDDTLLTRWRPYVSGAGVLSDFAKVSRDRRQTVTPEVRSLHQLVKIRREFRAGARTPAARQPVLTVDTATAAANTRRAWRPRQGSSSERMAFRLATVVGHFGDTPCRAWFACRPLWFVQWAGRGVGDSSEGRGPMTAPIPAFGDTGSRNPGDRSQQPLRQDCPRLHFLHGTR
jgi:hypothetical protein